VANEPGALRRVHFYGVRDLAAGFLAPRAMEIALSFDPARPPTTITDALELHNVLRYLENSIVPDPSTPEERDRLIATVPLLRSAVARFFNHIDGSNIATIVAEVDYEYRADLLELLGRSRVFERCDGDIVLAVLKEAGVHLANMLANRSLVQAYDTKVRDELLGSSQSAEILIRRFLEKDPRQAIHLPRSLTSADTRAVLESYIDGDNANLNYVRLIASAKDDSAAGIDAKLRLRAKRRGEKLNAEIFTGGHGFRTGVEVGVSDDQVEPVVSTVDSSDGWTQRYMYGRRWLDKTLDYPSVFNNFQHLFGFTDQQVILTLPSYPAALGVMERVMGLTGAAEYKVGAAFQSVDSSSLLQTHMYRQFLDSRGVDIEQAIQWFCQTYLVDEFGARNFTFSPSAGPAPYLQKVRNLFAEMESVANQFALFVDNGELDRELLTMGSDQVRYREIPSLVQGKYVYSTGTQDIEGILKLLFSDQSPLQYIDDSLKARSGVSLLLQHEVPFERFHEYQRADVQFLIDA
jgi:hypothetical protein